MGTRFLCLLRMFLSLMPLSLTTEKKLFCQTSAKEKRCNSKKIATLSKSCSVLSRTFLFALFFDFGNLFCRCGHNPYACIAHTVKKRVEINISSLTFLRLSLRPVRAAFIAAPKALKSYFGTGLFAIIIHPITFYCSPFLLDMSTLFYQLTKIIHMYMLTTSRFFCIVLLKGGKCLCYIACVFDKH